MGGGETKKTQKKRESQIVEKQFNRIFIKILLNLICVVFLCNILKLLISSLNELRFIV